MSNRASGAAAVAAVLLLASGCKLTGSDADDASESPSPSESSSTSASTSPSASINAADPEHAVDLPGPREGNLLPADILVASPDPLDDEVIQEIEDLGKVAAVETLSYAQVEVEGRVLDLAAVDPGTYRNYLQPDSADTQEVWDRVAGGEVALTPQGKKKLPIDDDGFLQLGSEEDAAEIHVGAFAPQVEGAVDAVVNEKWGEEMEMPESNAVLVSTLKASPDRVVKPIKKLVGDDVPVQRLDVVAREGLDPQAGQTAVVVGGIAEAVGNYRYTVSGGTVTPDPSWVSSHIVTETVPILGSVTCNKVMMPQLRAALQEVVQRGLAGKINKDEYAGCYYPRFIAGSTTLSNHAFGTALDINVPGNQRGSVGEIDRTVVAIFKKWGFAWGGDWSWTDPMHFEMNRLVDPGS